MLVENNTLVLIICGDKNLFYVSETNESRKKMKKNPWKKVLGKKNVNTYLYVTKSQLFEKNTIFPIAMQKST